MAITEPSQVPAYAISTLAMPCAHRKWSLRRLDVIRFSTLQHLFNANTHVIVCFPRLSLCSGDSMRPAGRPLLSPREWVYHPTSVSLHYGSRGSVGYEKSYTWFIFHCIHLRWSCAVITSVRHTPSFGDSCLSFFLNICHFLWYSSTYSTAHASYCSLQKCIYLYTYKCMVQRSLSFLCHRRVIIHSDKLLCSQSL